jgi:uncharacterized protein YkwD
MAWEGQQEGSKFRDSNPVQKEKDTIPVRRKSADVSGRSSSSRVQARPSSRANLRASIATTATSEQQHRRNGGRLLSKASTKRPSSSRRHSGEQQTTTQNDSWEAFEKASEENFFVVQDAGRFENVFVGDSGDFRRSYQKVSRRDRKKDALSVSDHGARATTPSTRSAGTRLSKKRSDRERLERQGSCTSLTDDAMPQGNSTFELQLESLSWSSAVNDPQSRNDFLLNQERVKWELCPLTRVKDLDDAAKQSAEAMAKSNGQQYFQTSYQGHVVRGDSITSIHDNIMKQKSSPQRHNILSPTFTEYGMAAVTGQDGMVYLCQLFRNSYNMQCMDT